MNADAAHLISISSLFCGSQRHDFMGGRDHERVANWVMGRW